jgi:anthranilate/para-aminobenzoate synthase component I
VTSSCLVIQESRTVTNEDDPLTVAVDMSRQWNPYVPDDLPEVFTGGWVGFVGYDTVRYTYPQKIPFESAPADDRNLLDLHLALYKDMAVFDSATKLIYLVSWVQTGDGNNLEELYSKACSRVRLHCSLQAQCPHPHLFAHGQRVHKCAGAALQSSGLSSCEVCADGYDWPDYHA